MEVERTVKIISLLSTLALISCGTASQSSNGSLINTESSSCAGAAVAQKYILKWKDGTTSFHDANTDQEFEAFVKPFAQYVDHAEHDHVIQIVKPSPTKNETTFVAPAVDWGQQIVHAPEVWAQGVEGGGITVAVVDSGADITHPQLAQQLAVNAGETGTDSNGKNRATNGIDDDQNGYVDDVNGYDFVNNSGNMNDSGEHGTHVSGIILANHTAGTIPGMAQKAKLLPLKFIDSTGNGNVSAAIKAIQYAVKRNAKVINASWGGGDCSQALKQEIMSLEPNGVMFVDAAGNSGNNLDSQPEWPAAYGLSGQMTVVATTSNDNQADFSNFSFKLADIAAPGLNITSTVPGNSTKVMSGTSMASPFVAGAAALLMSYRPTATVAQIKSALISSVDPTAVGDVAGGRMNVKKALDALKAQIPNP